MTSITELSPGCAMPPLERTISLPDMVAYAGATWDWHRLHYDADYVKAKQVRAPVVDGQVFGALLVEALQDWLGPGWQVRQLDFRFANLVFAGETVRCEGEVTTVGDGVVVVVLRVLVVGDRPRAAVETARAEVQVRP